ncbi:MAG: outer membrane lipoprotein carrier protein LolA [Burkholderiales bacterium]|nr:outer membrane lipoprotein carrier protein LolA [Burkholderiales bacterium]
MIARRRFIRAAALCAAACVLSATAAEPVPAIAASVRQRLGDEPVLRGEFEQRKSLKGFRNPLVSRGDFLVVRDKGVIWRTREPFASSLVVTRDRLLSRQADGSVATQLSARDEPGLRAINEMLFALMSADLAALAQRFRVDGELQGKDGWRLSLAPREAGVARWVSGIELEGDRFVRLVRLAEAQGDTTLIRFSLQTSAAAATREELARFD